MPPRAPVYVCRFVPLVLDAELVEDGAEDIDETVEAVEMGTTELARALDGHADADADADAGNVTPLVKPIEGTAELGAAEDGAEAEVALVETISVFPPTEAAEEEILLVATELVDRAELGAREEAAMVVADTTEDVAVALPEALYRAISMMDFGRRQCRGCEKRPHPVGIVGQEKLACNGAHPGRYCSTASLQISWSVPSELGVTERA